MSIDLGKLRVGDEIVVKQTVVEVREDPQFAKTVRVHAIVSIGDIVSHKSTFRIGDKVVANDAARNKGTVIGAHGQSIWVLMENGERWTYNEGRLSHA